MPASKRTKILIILAFPAGTMVFLFLLLNLIGRDIDKEHSIVRTALYPVSPTELWPIVSGISEMASWRTDVASIETLGDGAWRECSPQGDCLEFRQTESTQEQRLVFTTSDEARGYSRTWTITLEPVGDKTRVRIIEDGHIEEPLQRFIAKYGARYERALAVYLNDLAGHLGQALPYPDQPGGA